MHTNKLPPVHPGEVLLHEFIEPLGLTPYRLAKGIHKQQTAIGEIIAGERSVSAEMALRLARFFGVSPQFWLNLQARYDLDVAEDRAPKDIASIETFHASAR